jgi:hypothetical protein
MQQRVQLLATKTVFNRWFVGMSARCNCNIIAVGSFHGFNSKAGVRCLPLGARLGVGGLFSDALPTHHAMPPRTLPILIGRPRHGPRNELVLLVQSSPSGHAAP